MYQTYSSDSEDILALFTSVESSEELPQSITYDIAQELSDLEYEVLSVTAFQPGCKYTV